MTYWKPLVLDGQHIDLAHLEPFSFQMTPKDWESQAVIYVTFNNHCFSAAYDKEKHTHMLPVSHAPKHEKRGFDPGRYELSKLLPDLIRQFDNAKIAQNRKGTLVKLTLADGKSYGIFFVLKKISERTCELFVLSAYPLDNQTQQVVATGEMKFNVAVALVLKGKKPKFPPGRF